MHRQQSEGQVVEQSQQSHNDNHLCEPHVGDYCSLAYEPEPLLLDVFSELMV